MRLNSWLTGLFQELSIPSDSTARHRLLRRSPGNPANVEQLERRQLLSAGAAAVGFESRVNTYTPGAQTASDIAINGTGAYVVTWAGDGQDGSGYGIYAQRYNAAGTAQGSEFRVNTYTTGNEIAPSVAMDTAGDFVITWQSTAQDGSNYGIYAQRYNAAGIAQGAEFKVNTYTTGQQIRPSVAMDTTGAFVISWQSYMQDGSNYGVYAQRYNAAGTAQGGEFRVNTYTTGQQTHPSVAMDATGDFVIAWQSYQQSGIAYGIFAQRYNAVGTAQGGEFLVSTFVTGSRSAASAAMDAAGDFVITWMSYSEDGSSYGIYAQRYNAAGTVQGAEFRVNTYTTNAQVDPSVAMDTAGDFVVTWSSNNQDGSGYGIFAQRYNAAGTAQGLEFRVNTYTTNAQGHPMAAMDSAGDFVIAWRSSGQDSSNYGIYTQRYVTTVGPIVTGVFDGTGPRSVQNGDELSSSVTALSVQFSDSLNVTVGGANSVTNPSNWSLTRNLSDVSDLISGITFSFNASRNRWVAVVSFSQPLKSGTYSLVARQSIQDLTGRSLDGEADGLPGGNFRRNFSIATTVSIGAEPRVNTYTSGDQYTSDVAMDGAGDYVVTWTSSGQDGSGIGIYAQRYNKAGTPQGSEFRVNTYTTNSQFVPSVAMDLAGNFVITWQSKGQDGDDYGIYAQRYNAAGIAQGAEFKVNTYTTSKQTHPSVAMDATGDFVIAWQSYQQTGIAYGIFAQRYNSAGTAQGGEFLVSTFITGTRTSPTVAMDGAGDFVITWMSYSEDGSGYGIYAQRYNAAGISQGGEFKVNTYTTGAQEDPSVAMDTAGDFVVTWSSLAQDGSQYGIYAQRYNAAGFAQGVEFKVNTYTTDIQKFSSAAMDSVGDFVIAWNSNNQDGSSFGIYAQRYNAAGIAQGNEFKVNTYTTNSQSRPAAAMDSLGDFVVAWTSYLQDGSGDGIYAHRYQTDVAPVLSGIEGTTQTAVASASTAVTSSLLASDPDSNTWTGATIQIAMNYRSTEDLLGFVNTANITGSWNPATGTLTLTGTDSVSNYRTALRSVTYHNSSGSPNTALARTITFQATDGLLLSNVVSRDLTVLASSAPPVLSGVSGAGNYAENAAALPIAANLVASDPDSANLASATVSFTNWQAEDRVTFNNIFALQHTFTQDLTAHTAVLTITGAASPDHYQTLLRSVAYSDVSNNPITSARVASFRLNDGTSVSNIVTRNVSVTAINDPPSVSGIETTPLAYKANDPAFPPQAISASLLVAEPDSPDLTQALVQITAGYQNNASGHDILSFTNQLGITGSFNATTGTLTLTGVAPPGSYRTALRSVMFSTSGSNVSTTTRTLSITGTDDFLPTHATSLAVTRNVTVSTTNIPPALTGIPSAALTYVRGAAGAIVAPGLFVVDSDSINMTGATIQLTANYQNGQDVLAFTAGFGVTGTFTAATGTLTLTGTTSVANYQTLLRSVTYKTNSATASTLTRTISFTINDGLAPSSSVLRNVTLT